MIFSLPSYRRLSEADLERFRNAGDQQSSIRVARALFNILLLAGLWGAPLYARWCVLSDMKETPSLSEAVLGQWRYGDKSLLEFTSDQQIRLSQDGMMIETASYRIVGDVLEIYDFKLQLGHHDLEINQQRYQISILDENLIVRPSAIGFTPVPEHTQWERSGLRMVLPQFHGASVQFRRRDKP